MGSGDLKLARALERVAREALPPQFAAIDAKREHEHGAHALTDRREYVDRLGEPLTLGQWAYLAERGTGYWWVAYDEGAGWSVSTIWLGIDHSFGAGPGIYFETLVRPGEEMHRYPTEGAAISAHDQLVAALVLRDGTDPRGEPAAEPARDDLTEPR